MRGFLAVVALSGLLLSGCASQPPAGPAGSAASRSGVGLVDVGSVEVLRQRFNQDAGATRLVLFLSPT